MINQVFRSHGLPTNIVSDRGLQFVSVFWKEFCHILGATVSLSSGYHPESNGQTERLNQELETCLRYLVSQNQTTWSDYLTWIEYAHNALPTAATGLSPFHVVYGYQPPLFPVNEEEVTVPSAHAMARRCRKPGSQNAKPDALSHLYEPDPTAKGPETILPPDRVVGAVTWQIEKDVQ
ncbi:hypothetical protein L3Q82_002949 [Scortum barcoo]|uniref:Uncharacterized protein n=1 Tax=Scortum barcoo TaxID=214431 RepID=A0ACB8VV16_9TELE|nr:hypothetical protein L3Q82_002949 [Scortum barcoo]